MTTAAMTKPVTEISPNAKARMAGVFYLLNIVTILAAVFCFRGLVVPRDAAATATNLVAHESLFRFAVAIELISTACSLIVAALLYELFQPVNKSVSLIAAFFRVVACAVAVFGYVLQLASLQTLRSSQFVTGIRVEELPSIAFLFQRIRGPASDFVIVLFGFHFLFLGYLIYKSVFFPRALGILAVLAGLGALVFIVPPEARPNTLYLLIIGLITEVWLTLSLLLTDVNVLLKERMSS